MFILVNEDSDFQDGTDFDLGNDNNNINLRDD